MESNESKNFVEKHGKYLRFSLEKEGIPFYILVEYGKDGNIKQIMEKPNFKEMKEQIHISGLHVIIDFPERNHYDHYEKGKEWKEKKTDSNETYWVSGSSWGI